MAKSRNGRLGELWKASGIPQAEIARRIGEDRDWMSRRVNGRTVLAVDDLPRLARAMGVNPCEFIDTAEVDERQGPRTYETPTAPPYGREPRISPGGINLFRQFMDEHNRNREELAEEDVETVEQFLEFLQFRRSRETGEPS